MLAISTSWNYKENIDIEKMLNEIKQIGFEAIELGYHITHQDLEKIIGLLGAIDLKVTNIHNFCPVPYDAPSPRHASNYYRLSSLDEQERKKAVEWTKVSIDTAFRVKTKVVALHAGTVVIEKDPSGTFLDLYRQGKAGTQEFKDFREKILKLREENRAPFLKALDESFQEIMPYAKEKGVQIGIETRYYPFEIPNFEEIEHFLSLFQGQGMGYWHDVGHAEVNERLGIQPHLDFLERYKKYLIGMHIHGVKVLKDHFSPLDGDFDLNKIKSFITPELIQVIETHPFVTLEQIKEVFKRLSYWPFLNQ